MMEEDNLLNGGYLEFLLTILSGIVSPHDANAGCCDRRNPQPAPNERRKIVQ